MLFLAFIFEDLDLILPRSIVTFLVQGLSCIAFRCVMQYRIGNVISYFACFVLFSAQILVICCTMIFEFATFGSLEFK